MRPRPTPRLPRAAAVSTSAEAAAFAGAAQKEVHQAADDPRVTAYQTSNHSFAQAKPTASLEHLDNTRTEAKGRCFPDQDSAKPGPQYVDSTLFPLRDADAAPGAAFPAGTPVLPLWQGLHRDAGHRQTGPLPHHLRGLFGGTGSCWRGQDMPMPACSGQGCCSCVLAGGRPARGRRRHVSTQSTSQPSPQLAAAGCAMQQQSRLCS